MIERYTRDEIGALWTDEARMEAWRRVKVAACKKMDGPTEAELEAIRDATFTVRAVQERERVTDHDVAAFVDVLQQSAGPGGRWIHFGLTSSDVLDTALALQLQAVGDATEDFLVAQWLQYPETLLRSTGGWFVVALVLAVLVVAGRGILGPGSITSGARRR